MSKIVKTVLSTLLITMTVCSSAFAAPISTERTYTGNANTDNSNIIATGNGTEIEYLRGVFGHVFTDCPKVIKTVTQGEPGNTIKYMINLYSNEHEPDESLPRTLVKSGDYVTLNNIIKEGTYAGQRIVYSGGPIDINFHTPYFYMKNITGHDSYMLDDKGEVVGAKIKEYYYDNGDICGPGGSGDTYYDIYGDHNVTLTEPGLYHINIGKGLEHGIGFYVCIDKYYADGGQSLVVNDNKAVPGAVDVSVNGKWTNVPCYTMNGNKYMRVRDLGYILNGTSSQFNPYYNAGSKCMNLNQIDNPARNATNSYQAIGGELSALSSNTIENPKAYDGYFMIKSKTCNPSAFDVDGWTFVRVDHVAELLGISVSMSETGNMYIYA